MFSSAFLALSFFFLPLVSSRAVPTAPYYARRDGGDSVSVLSGTDVDSTLLRPAEFARVAYCSSQAVTSLSCGPPCDALGGGVEFLASGGDQGAIPLFFVAHDPSTQSIVVAHEGTDPKKILSIANDIDFGLTDINATRFPAAASKGVQVHAGFQDTFERTADLILSTVQSGLASKNVNKVIVTGHSLGAAIATMDGLMLATSLPASTTVTTTTFGLPRGGNQAFADFIDASLPAGAYTFVTNQQDPVTIVPPRILGFQHPHGEVHIKAVDDNGQATNIVSCPGQENSNCSEGNSLLDSDVQNHLGPYFDNISLGGKACPV